MPLINFSEIPRANAADGKQDTFELFARDFLSMLGFTIIQNPDRGQDGGRDLIIEENRNGLLNNTKVRWLVSCKHKSHSGSSVNDSDEADISDRVRAHNCNGFLGFYSTVTSSPLARKLEGLKNQGNFEIQIFDNEKIESILLLNQDGFNLIKRYFPDSYSNMSSKRPSNLFTEYAPLNCKVCGKDLLSHDVIDKYMGVIVFCHARDYYYEEHKYNYKSIYWACKGKCDKVLEKSAYENGLSTGWEDISDLVIPYKYLTWLISILNRTRNYGDTYDDTAYEDLKSFIICISQMVYKDQSTEDIQRIIQLRQLPEGV